MPEGETQQNKTTHLHLYSASAATASEDNYLSPLRSSDRCETSKKEFKKGLIKHFFS